MHCHCLVSKQPETPKKALCAINKFGVSFFAMYNLYSQAVYLHHKPHSSWTAKHLFQVQLPFSHRRLCFQDQSESPSTCPRPACCNLSLRTSSPHTCEACYLWDSQDPSPWPSGDSRGYTKNAVMTDPIRFGIWETNSGLFSPPFTPLVLGCAPWHVSTGVVFYEAWIISFIVPVWLKV